MSASDDNYNWFKENLSELVKKYEDRFIVIKDKRVIADFTSFDNAFSEISEKETPGTYIIQLCFMDENKISQTFFTHRVNFS